MTKDIDTDSYIGKAVKIHLKDGSSQVGYIPGKLGNATSGKNVDKFWLAFLPYDKIRAYNAFIKLKSKHENLDDKPAGYFKQFVSFIKKIDIDSIEVLEINKNPIVVNEAKKPVPRSTALGIVTGIKPGHATIHYFVSNPPKKFLLGEFQIINGKITIPLKVVFISYPKKEYDVIKPIVDILHENGILIWLDEHELLPGDNWKARISDAIQKSDYILIFFSSKSINDDGYKNKEIREALEHGQLKPLGKRYIIPILIDDVELPSEFENIQWIKIKEDNWMEKLLEVIKK